jgi:hypothetical protein
MYALGYSFGNGLKIQKTGILVLDSKPDKGKIYLNGNLQQDFIKKIYKKDSYKTTPQKIKNLLPGEYNIKIELEGYWPWEKKLNIQPGQATFAEDIKLFKKDTPLLLSKGEKNISTADRQENVFIWNEQEATLLSLTDEKNKNIKLASTSLSKNETAQWSPNFSELLIGSFLLNKNQQIINLKDNIDKSAHNFQWDNYSDEYVYYTDNTGLKKYHINDKIGTEIVNNKNINDFFIQEDFIYFLNNNKESTILNIFNIREKKVINTLNLPLSDYSFINKEQKLLNIFDKKYNILHLLNPNSSLKHFKDSLNNISTKNRWINNTQLIYANDFEIWMYDLETAQKKLITRISKKITNIFWLPSNGHILFSTNNNINIIELDDREKYNITKLIETEQIKNITLNKNSSILYFNATINGEQGIYKLSIE